MSGRNVHYQAGVQEIGAKETIMEMELKTIIEKIKQEGVGEAEKKAAHIIETAQAGAKRVLDQAREERAAIIKKAEQEAAKLRDNGEKALSQASRDVLLSLREQIIELFDKVVKREVAAQLTPDVLKEMILKLVEKFEKEEKLDLEILLSKKEKKDLEEAVFSALKGEMKKGVTIKISPVIEHGFFIGEKDKGSYYDFTDEAIAEAFMAYLNPKIVDILAAEKKDEK
ncbi:MAG: V-type ATP synthase subunit E [Candidatus Omnitrophota bacterium]